MGEDNLFSFMDEYDLEMAKTPVMKACDKLSVSK
jgi:hypothetical protein